MNVLINGTVNNSIKNETDVVDNEKPERQWDNIFAASIMFFPIFFGLGCYICFCVVLFRYRKKISNAYYQFIVSITFSNAPMLLMFGFYAAPCTLFQKEFNFTLNYSMGALSNLLWFTSLPMYQCIAVNRFISLKYPFKVKTIYSQRNVYCMIAFCWMYGLVYYGFSLHPCCYFMYFPDTYSFAYDSEHRFGSYIISFVDLSNSIITAVVCVSFNTATFLHLRKNNRQVQTSLSDDANNERTKTEKKLFVLFFVVIIYLLIHDAIFIVVPFITTSKWGGLLTDVTYIIHLSLDGVINLCFNKTMNDKLKKIFKKTWVSFVQVTTM